VFDVSYGGALLAGLLSFISPCVLPIVPPYLAYLAGLSFDELNSDSAAKSRRVVLSAIAFVLGFTTVFVMLGATASVLGRTIAQYFDVLSMLAGALIIVMGLHFIGLFRIALLYREARLEVARKPAGFIGAYVMGLAFAFGWTPCVGPVLAAILFVAGGEGTALRGASLLATYSFGIGIPFIVAAFFAPAFVRWANRFKRHTGLVEKAIGALLVLTGILFMTGQMSAIAQWLLETFPVLGRIG
jgi:cytochrome c-type biogenesis protein